MKAYSEDPRKENVEAAREGRSLGPEQRPVTLPKVGQDGRRSLESKFEESFTAACDQVNPYTAWLREIPRRVYAPS